MEIPGRQTIKQRKLIYGAISFRLIKSNVLCNINSNDLNIKRPYSYSTPPSDGEVKLTIGCDAISPSLPMLTSVLWLGCLNSRLLAMLALIYVYIYKYKYIYISNLYFILSTVIIIHIDS